MLLLAHLRERHVQGCVIRFNVSKVWCHFFNPFAVMNPPADKSNLLFQLAVASLAARTMVADVSYVITARHITPRDDRLLLMHHAHDEPVLLVIPTGVNVSGEPMVKIAAWVPVIRRRRMRYDWSESFSSPRRTDARIITRGREIRAGIRNVCACFSVPLAAVGHGAHCFRLLRLYSLMPSKKIRSDKHVLFHQVDT